jgi:hypothetical protein
MMLSGARFAVVECISKHISVPPERMNLSQSERSDFLQRRSCLGGESVSREGRPAVPNSCSAELVASIAILKCPLICPGKIARLFRMFQGRSTVPRWREWPPPYPWSFVTASNRPAGMGSGRQAVSSPGWSEGRAKCLPHKQFFYSHTVASCRSSDTGYRKDLRRDWLSKSGVQRAGGFDATIRITSVTQSMESVQQTRAMCCFKSLRIAFTARFDCLAVPTFPRNPVETL